MGQTEDYRTHIQIGLAVIIVLSVVGAFYSFNAGMANEETEHRYIVDAKQVEEPFDKEQLQNDSVSLDSLQPAVQRGVSASINDEGGFLSHSSTSVTTDERLGISDKEIYTVSLNGVYMLVTVEYAESVQSGGLWWKTIGIVLVLNSLFVGLSLRAYRKQK